MTQYDNTNSGALFKNNFKESDKHPDYKGKIDVGGKEYELAAWIREGKKGKFMSLKLSEPYQKSEGRSAQEPMSDVLQDDIPF